MSLRSVCVKNPVPALKIALPTLVPLKFAFIREIRGQKNSCSRVPVFPRNFLVHSLRD